MQRISPHFVCPALFQDAFRYTFAYRKVCPITIRARFLTPRRRFCTQNSPVGFDDDMGKEDKNKSFNLKVPKGTRDCTSCLDCAQTMY
jgi:histidyl-tRNA synthetase